MCSPAATKHNVVLSVKEIRLRDELVEPVAFFMKRKMKTKENKHTGICRIQSHGFEAFVFYQRGAGPFPHSTHSSLPS